MRSVCRILRLDVSPRLFREESNWVFNRSRSDARFFPALYDVWMETWIWMIVRPPIRRRRSTNGKDTRARTHVTVVSFIGVGVGSSIVRRRFRFPPLCPRASAHREDFDAIASSPCAPSASTIPYVSSSERPTKKKNSVSLPEFETFCTYNASSSVYRRPFSQASNQSSRHHQSIRTCGQLDAHLKK